MVQTNRTLFSVYEPQINVEHTLKAQCQYIPLHSIQAEGGTGRVNWRRW